jgi:magnesium chelatase subunit D
MRIVRFKRDAPSLTIFAVDASGSAAMHRLGEAKGAVELLLAECYARREQVALVAFRGTGAEVLLPPTRALARARRTLAQLAGGGATPLARGIDAAYELALKARRSGQSSLVVLLTDGRANIDGEGVADRKRAAEHAAVAARRLAADRIGALLVDVASAPSAKAADLARHMNARYLPLPNAGAREIAGAVALGRHIAG